MPRGKSNRNHFQRLTDWVVITTHNEAETIGPLLERLGDFRVGRIVVDERSTDGTKNACLAGGLDEYIPIDMPYHFGIGACQRVGMRRALAYGAKRVAIIDAGGSHDPADVVRLFQCLTDADMIIGSRFVPGGRYVRGNGPRWRPIGSRLYARLMNASIHGAKFRDWTSGFRAFRAPLVQYLCKQKYIGGMNGWHAESLAHANAHGAKILEIPITYTFTESAFRASTAAEMISVWLHTMHHIGGRPKTK